MLGAGRLGGPLLLGHRGAPQLAPENTLDAFRAALDAGLDGLEIDVQRTRDGVLAVVHDPVVASGMRVADMEWSELRAAQPDMPRLEEVFELLEGWNDRHLNVELKVDPERVDGSAAVLADAMASWRAAAVERAWISCFDPASLVALRRAGTKAPLALLVVRAEDAGAARELPGFEVSGIHPHYPLCTRENVERWHDAGWFVVTWTVNRREDARVLAKAGVDGLIGDHPDELQAAVGGSAQPHDRKG